MIVALLLAGWIFGSIPLAVLIGKMIKGRSGRG